MCAWHDFYYTSSLRFLAICQEKLGETEDVINTSKKLLKYRPEDKKAKERIEKFSGFRKGGD